LRNITDYCFVEYYNGNGLGERVRALIKDGWQPYGSPAAYAYTTSISAETGDFMWGQAMVKYAEWGPSATTAKLKRGHANE
jgi:hypothetical protein